MAALRKTGVVLCASLTLAISARAERPAKSPQTTSAGSWASVGAGITGDHVADLAVFGTQLVAGGVFTEVGGQLAGNVAAWDGTSWSPLGSGLNGGVSSVTVLDNQLIVAGSFTHAGGVAANHIAAWNGSAWAPLGAGVSPAPAVICAYNGKVYAGVNTTIGSLQEPISYLYAWNGSTWQLVVSFSPGLMPSVVYITGLDVAAGKLFIGGLFADQRGFHYDGSSLTPTGAAGIYVRAFAEFGGQVYETGFSPLVARWNGGTAWTYDLNGSSAWDGCGSGYDLAVHDGLLVMAGGWGGFSSCPPNDYLMTWDGTNWSTLGTGMNGIIEALAVHNGRLFAAGHFSTADGNSASLIAQWAETPVKTEQKSWGGVKAMFRDGKQQ